MSDEKSKLKSGDDAITIDEAVERIGFGRFQLGLVFICGCIQAADSMEMILLSFLGQPVQCQWHLTAQMVALITTCVFVGSIVGSPLLGAISDRYGRWNTLLLSASLIAYYGLLSAASPSIYWICFLRAMVGFAIGGLLPLTSTMTSEFLPMRWRANFIVVMMGFWTIGSLFEVLVAWATLGTEHRDNSWRITMLLTALPLCVLLPLFAWMPRSPRYLLAAGRPQEALDQLNRAAASNRQPQLRVQLQEQRIRSRGSIRLLFGNAVITQLTLLLIVIWFCCGLLYYGLILLATELPLTKHRCLQDWTRSSLNDEGAGGSSIQCCQSLSNADYATAAFATLGEFLGYAMLLLLIESVGRRLTMLICCVSLVVLVICLQLCMPQQALAGLLFLTRAFGVSLFNTTYIYSNEAFPTCVRTLGMGVCCAGSRVGALLSPFVAQVLLTEHSTFAALCIYSGTALLAGIATCFLPFDTKGRELMQSVQETVRGPHLFSVSPTCSPCCSSAAHKKHDDEPDHHGNGAAAHDVALTDYGSLQKVSES